MYRQDKEFEVGERSEVGALESLDQKRLPSIRAVVFYI